MLDKSSPTIVPSDKPHTINEPSREIVKQSMSSGNEMTFASMLCPVIKSFSNKCNALSIATTTCSLRNVATNFGSRLIYSIRFDWFKTKKNKVDCKQIKANHLLIDLNGVVLKQILTEAGSLFSIWTKVFTENVSLNISSSDSTVILFHILLCMPINFKII